MRRILIIAVLAASCAGMFSSCKKTLADDYLNPESTTTGSLPKLFTNIFLNERIHPTYWDYRTFILLTPGAYAQSSVSYPGNTMWVPNTSYVENRWTDFYSGGILNSYREMQTSYSSLSASEQAKQYVFLELAQVVIYDELAQVVDMWGDVPYSDANSLNTSRTAYSAKFDDAAGLYTMMIDSLASINTYLASASLETDIKKSLSTNDLIYAGTLDSWRRYANSLRLRLLMRTSNYDESTAKSAVSTMLADASTYPLIDDNTYNAEFKMSPTTYSSDILSAFTELYPYAPAYMLDTVMAGNGDPRTAVYWDSVGGVGYKGIPTSAGSGTFDTAGGYYSTYDSATFLYNYNLPGVLFNAAETDFLKAEAYERWSLGTASDAYYAGIDASIAFWYGINQSRILRSGSYPVVTSPTDADVTAFKANANIVYSGSTTEKLAKIYTQKWVHFFIVQSGQAWAEQRRTGYPVLNFYSASYSGYSQPPVRLTYPSTETLYNTQYSTVQTKDTRSTKIFWDVN